MHDAPHPVAFWYEFASPYSYLAAMTVEDRALAAGVPLLWRPFLLGPIFTLQGWDTSHFNLNPRRGAYMFHDLARSCAFAGLPWRKPAVFPKPSTFAARVAVEIQDEPWIGDDRAIGEEATFAEIVRALGQDPTPIFARMREGERANRLREQTQEAIALGLFGARNFVVDGELFWGEETIDQALQWAFSCRRPLVESGEREAG